MIVASFVKIINVRSLFCFTRNSEEPDKESLEKFLIALTNATYDNFENVPSYSGIVPNNYMETILNLSTNLSPTLTIGATGIILNIEPTITEMGLCYAINSKVAVYNDPK